MLIDEVMYRYPTCIRLGSTVRHAADLLSASDIGMLMVLDDQERFVGVLTETAVLGAVLPDAEEIHATGNTMNDAFRAFVTKGASVAEHTVDSLVTRNPITIARGVEAAAAAVVLLDRKLPLLPVLEGRTVVGTVSRRDLCRAVLAHADQPESTAAAPEPAEAAARSAAARQAAAGAAVPAARRAPAARATSAAAAAAAGAASPRAEEIAARAAAVKAGRTGARPAAAQNAQAVAAKARLEAARARAAARSGGSRG